MQHDNQGQVPNNSKEKTEIKMLRAKLFKSSCSFSPSGGQKYLDANIQSDNLQYQKIGLKVT